MLEQIEKIGQEINASLAEVDSKKKERIKGICQEWSEKNSETVEHEGKEYTYQERYRIALIERERILERMNSPKEEKLSAKEIIEMGEALRVLEDFIQKYREAEEIIEQRKNEANIVRDEKATVIKNGINSVINAIEAEIAELVTIRSSVDLSGDIDDVSEKLKNLAVLNGKEKELIRFLEEMRKLLSYDGSSKDVDIDLSEDYKKILEEFYKVINTLEIDMNKENIIVPITVSTTEEDKKEDEAKVARINAIIEEIEKSPESYSELDDKFEEMLEISRTIKNEKLRLEKNAEIEKLRDSKIKSEIEDLLEKINKSNDFAEIKILLEKIESLLELLTDEIYKKDIKTNLEKEKEHIDRVKKLYEIISKVSDESIALAQRKIYYDEVVQLAKDFVRDYEEEKDELEKIIEALKRVLDEYEEKYNAIKAKVENLIRNKNLEDYNSVLDEVQTLGTSDRMELEKMLKDFCDSIEEEFDEVLSRCQEKIENQEFLDEEEVILLGKYYMYLSDEKAESCKDIVKAIIAYHNKTKQIEVQENYESKKEGFFASLGKAVKFISGSKIMTNIRLKTLNKLKEQHEDAEEQEEKERIEKKAVKVKSGLIKSSVIGGLRLCVAQKKLEKLKTKLYSSEKFNGYSVRKQNRLLRKQQKSLGTIEAQMVKGLDSKKDIQPVSKEYATSIVDQYIYLIATSESKNEEGNFDLSKYIEALNKYLNENKSLFTENEIRAIQTEINLIREYRESYNGDIYEITSNINGDGAVTNELDDIVTYYDSEEVKGYRNHPAYIKR